MLEHCDAIRWKVDAGELGSTVGEQIAHGSVKINAFRLSVVVYQDEDAPLTMRTPADLNSVRDARQDREHSALLHEASSQLLK